MPVPQGFGSGHGGQPSCFQRMKMGFAMGFCVGAVTGCLFGGFNALRSVFV